MRSYSDVVSGSGKFMFGVYCNCLRAILPNHVQSFISLRVVRVRVVVQVSSLLTILVFVTFCE